MRTAAALAVLTLTVAACHDAPTEAFSRASGPAPTGLPVTLQIAVHAATTAATESKFWAQGDSLVISVAYEYSVCRNYSATAGAEGGSVVVTITESKLYYNLNCADPDQTATFLAVVRPAPSGAYPVVLRQRLEYLVDGPVERERARGTVTLP